MQTEFSIELDRSTLRLGDYDGIAGEVWVAVGDWALPDKNWSDFPVVILNWWIRETIALAEGSSDVAKWLFMDGPHWICFRRVESSDWRVTAHEHRLKGIQETEIGHVNGTQVLEELRRVARETLAECRQRQWQTPDISGLESALRYATDCLVE